MAQFTPKRQEQILAQMIAQVVSNTDLSDISDASVLKHLLSASARQDDEQYFQMQNLLTLFSVDSAVGEDLDERAKDVQPSVISRLGARESTGSVVFSRNGITGTTIISKGTKIKTSSGVVVTTTVDGIITPTSLEQVVGHGVGRDSVPVSSIADTPAAKGNVAANTLIKFDGGKPPGIDEVTNLSSFVNGRDAEADDAFRQRIKDFISGLARCPVGAIESNLIGQQDPVSNGTILFAKVFEDQVSRGNITAYIDDGTGSAETTTTSVGSTIVADLIWNGTTTITSVDTSEITIGDYIGLRSDNQLFKVVGITPNTNCTIVNPGALTIPTGSGASSSFANPEKVTLGLLGPPADTAVGGEVRLFLDNKPIKEALVIRIISSIRGVLSQGVGNDVLINPASGQMKFTPALVAGESIFAEYTYYTGLIAFAQKIIDGDPNDRANFPGLRAGGVLAQALPPQVLLQNVSASITVHEGFIQTDARDDARQAIKDYINALSISGDVVRAELIKRIMNIQSIKNVNIIIPSNDVVLLDDQLARTQDPNIIIT